MHATVNLTKSRYQTAFNEASKFYESLQDFYVYFHGFYAFTSANASYFIAI
jgi:hypothetical protein